MKDKINSLSYSKWLGRALRWLTPNGGTLLVVIVLLLTQNVWARSAAGSAAAPGPAATTVNYQGRLSDSSGNPLTGSYDMSFSLWDAANGGNKVWGPESQAAVPVNDGLFHVGLGSQTSGGIPTSVWEGDRYLEITVDGETLSPRELVRSVPIAGMALTVPDHAITGQHLAKTGFGASNVPLRNFVIREPVAQADFSIDTEVTEATWDLRPIVGTSAEMIALLVWIRDEAEYSHFQAWPNGEPRRVGVNAPFIRPDGPNKGNSRVMWVRCDSTQTIKYKAIAEGNDNDELSLRVTVVGWVEPAAVP
jgi:hypothetical protein